MKKGRLLKQRHTLSLFLPGLKEPVSFQLPMSDAVKPVTLERKEADAFNGKPGYAVECMNAQCGLREMGKFPHPVHLIEFTDSRCFVVDKVNKAGQPLHCVRYYHHDGDEQKEFDLPGGKQRLIKSGRVNKPLVLLAPTSSTKHKSKRKPTVQLKDDEQKIRKRTGKRKASFARALRSGVYRIAA